MSSAILVLLVASIGLAAIVSMRRDPRIGRGFVGRSVAALALNFGAVGLGTWCAWTMAVDRAAPVAAAVFGLAWLVLVTSALIQYAPRLNAPPGPAARRLHQIVRLAAATLASAAALAALG